jgi:ATP-dependent Lon protease
LAGIAKTIVAGGEIPTYLGPPKFKPETVFRTSRPGVATGVAWTETGGDVLFIEASLLPSGKGNIILTGQLGSVMQESARAAVSHIRAQADALGVPPDFLDTHDLHVHVPAGAIPKDGPSAGVTIATAFLSVCTNVKVKWDVAMTGEITLRGKVLPIGGVKEKLLAAHRIGVTTVILPRENEKDLADVPKNVLEGMEVQLVDHIDEVLKIALLPPETPPARVETGETGDVMGTVPDGMTH